MVAMTRSDGTEQTTRAQVRARAALAALKALSTAIDEAEERGLRLAWVDTADDLAELNEPSSLPLGFTVGELWRSGAGVEVILPLGICEREPLVGVPLALAYRSFAVNRPTSSWTVTRRLRLSAQSVRLVRRTPGLIARMAEAARECSRRLAEQPRLAAVAACEDPSHQRVIRYAVS
jgi:hypothetical protein